MSKDETPLRQQRVAEALRANLQRRKAQGRELKEPVPESRSDGLLSDEDPAPLPPQRNG